MSSRLQRIEKWETLARQANFQPAEMAALCPISLRQLERFFKQHYDKTPTEWNRELRFRIAIELIGKGYSNKAASIELKFANQSHFCHEFKKVYGITPQSFAPMHGRKTEMSRL